MKTRMIYLARRNPVNTHDEFVANWREHIALGAQFPSVYRRFGAVVQGDVLVDSPALAGHDDVPSGFDGVEIADVRDLPTGISVWDDPDAQATLVPDERRVFATIVQDLTLWALASVLIEGPRTHYFMTRLLKRSSALSREDFIREWAALPVPEHASLRRYARNYVILDPPPAVNFDGVEELWFDTADDMTAYLLAAQTREHHSAEARLIAGPAVVLPTRVGIAYPPVDA